MNLCFVKEFVTRITESRYVRFLVELIRSSETSGRILRGSFGSVVLKLGHTVLYLVLTVVLARVLGPEQLGIYTFVLAVIVLLSIPAQFGIPNLVVRETAKAKELNDWGRMLGLWIWAKRGSALLAVVIITAAFTFTIVFFESESDDYLKPFLWGLPLVFLLAAEKVRSAALRGLENVILGIVPEFLIRPIAFIVLVVLVTVMNFELTATGTVAVHACAVAISFLACTCFLFGKKPVEITAETEPNYDTVVWMRSVVPLGMISGLQLIMTYTDVVTLGLFETPENVGIYRIAVQGATLVAFGLQAVNMVLSPHFARLYTQGDLEALQRMVTGSARSVLYITVPVVLIFLCFGKYLISTIFGAQYTDAYSALVILSLCQAVNVAFGSVGVLLNMTGNERQAMRGIALATLLNVLLNAVLIPLYGMTGAAFATGISLITWNILLSLSIRRTLGINSRAF